MKIGVFDSGLGGLTVLRCLWQALPGADYVYLGDTARVPYGIRSQDVIARYARECFQFLIEQSIDLCVVACNTVSAYALDALQAQCDIPIIGVVEPGVEAVIASAPQSAIGIVGTEATIRSQAYESRLLRALPHLPVFSSACPLFVPLVEEGWFDHPVTRQVVESYMGHFKAQAVDAIVLGCTHYPLLKPLIQEVMGAHVRLIDSAEATATEVRRRFGDRIGAREGHTSFFVTDQADRFDRIASLFLGKTYGPVTQVSVG